MRINLKLFAGHRERLGVSELQIEVPAGSSAADVFDQVATSNPALGTMRRFTTFARNREVVPASTELADGDELALLQPVSGGAKSNDD
jgi:molybdopterin converting factor small subunit